jgi:hypothetical protein
MNEPRPFFSFVHERDKNVTLETFYDKDLEWNILLENNYSIIKNEIIDLISDQSKDLKPYFAKEMINAPGKWKALSFYFWGMKMNKKAIEKCPETIRILSCIPNLVSASVSIMEPHSEIKPHFGDTDAIYRCHFGITIPAPLPECGIRVGYEDRSWQEGKLLAFNDSNYHKTWNHTDKRRIVLLIDVIKPKFGDQKEWICSRVYGNIIWQSLSETTTIFRGKKNNITKSISWINAVLIRLYHSLKRKSASL